jgi:hypothetical protein
LDKATEKVVERLRASGQAPRFVAEGEAKLPPQLQSPPAPPRRQVGRRIISGAPNDKGGWRSWISNAPH